MTEELSVRDSDGRTVKVKPLPSASRRQWKNYQDQATAVRVSDGKEDESIILATGTRSAINQRKRELGCHDGARRCVGGGKHVGIDNVAANFLDKEQSRNNIMKATADVQQLQLTSKPITRDSRGLHPKERDGAIAIVVYRYRVRYRLIYLSEFRNLTIKGNATWCIPITVVLQPVAHGHWPSSLKSLNT